MKKWLFIIISIYVYSIHAQSLDQNFTMSIVPKKEMTITEVNAIINSSSGVSDNITIDKPVSNENFVASKSITLSPNAHLTPNVILKIGESTITNNNSLYKNITYYDGLGRPVQSNAIGQNPEGKDIVQHYEYDEFGRSEKLYLPLPRDQDTGNFVSDPVPQITSYYQNKYGDTNPFSQQGFDDSPLSRVLESASPGNDWQLSDDANINHTIKQEYGTNTAIEVKKYDINEDGSFVESYYSANELTKITIKNENWTPLDGSLNTIESFTDKNGRKISEIAYNKSVNGTVEKLITNYIYDDFGRLTYVVPPKASLVDNVPFSYPDFDQQISWLDFRTSRDATGSGGARFQYSNGRVTLDFDLVLSPLQNLRTGRYGTRVNLPDMYIGTTDDPKVPSYDLEIKNGYLYITGAGLVNSIDHTFTVNFQSNLSKIDPEVLDQLCFQYKHDAYNRQIAQKVPGKGWEYVVYDPLDRPILTQDANLKEENTWLFTKFDAFGRIVYSGKYESIKSANDLQLEVDTFFISSTNKSNIERKTTNTIQVGGASFNYSNEAFPITGITEVLGINYFDNYDFIDIHKPVTPINIEGQLVTSETKGLPTSNWIKTLGGNSWTKSYIYYDEKGRGIKTYTKNYQNGFVDLESKIDFRGKVTKSTTKHKKSNSSTLITISDRFEYDTNENLTSQYQKINNQPEERIANYIYDELGIISNKKVGGLTSSNNALQNISFKYNIRGWLKQVNDVDNLGSSLFAFEIKHNEGSEGISNVANLYNGYASQTIWKSKYDNLKKSYTYSYDKANRLKKAEYTQGNSLNQALGLYSTTISGYDSNGNILGLNRKGVNSITSSPTTIDALQYQYDTGNKLINVIDTGHSSSGFIDVNNSITGDYEYDANGNLTKDRNRKIDKIYYNHLDLVSRIDFEDGKQLLFTYNAAGEKLSKTYVAGGSPTSTYYLSGFQYENNRLKFFPTAEGYAYNTSPNDNTISIKYAYNYADHLGNILLTYTDTNGNNTIETNEIISNRSYYPMGMIQPGQFMSGIASSFGYAFQGKELQNENNLGIYDFGSRMYYPGLGRWFNTDPQNQFGSPYLAMGNNWPNGIDPNGEIFVIDDVIIGAVTGIGNVIGQAIAGNIDSVGDGFAYFGIGFVGGLTATYTGGIGTAAIIAGGNSAYGQYDQNGSIDPTQLLLDTGFGALTGGIGSYAGSFIQTQFSGLFSGISNQLVRDLTVQVSSQATTGFVLGTGFSLATGNSLEDSFNSGLQGFATGIATGTLTAAQTNFSTKYQDRQNRASKIEQIKAKQAEQAATKNNPTQVEESAPRAMTLGEMEQLLGGNNSFLQFHEGRGLGHTISRHVAKTDSDLIGRITNSRGITGASTYPNQASAESIISSTIRANRATVKSWLRSGSTSNLRLNYTGSSTPIGRGIMRGQNSVSNKFNARVVLRPNGNGGYFILTSFPE